MSDFKPMLAGKAELDKLQFPVLASAKLDGVRAIVIDGKVYSRSLKLIPSAWVQRTFGVLPDGTDGELIAGEPTDKAVYRKTTSEVMSEDGGPVSFYAFDNYKFPGGFMERYKALAAKLARVGSDVVVVAQYTVNNLQELLTAEEKALEAGYEGLIVRSLTGKYKFGRSSTKEGIMLKVKRYVDAEAKVIGVVAWQHNANEATTNALGRTERSSHKANMIDKPILGKLVVVGLTGDFARVEFEIGTGFDGADDPEGERGLLWKQRDSLIGKIVKYKYFPVGTKDKPRHPVFLGFRSPLDM
jgi:DNA ligase-1